MRRESIQKSDIKTKLCLFILLLILLASTGGFITLMYFGLRKPVYSNNPEFGKYVAMTVIGGFGGCLCLVLAFYTFLALICYNK